MCWRYPLHSSQSRKIIGKQYFAKPTPSQWFLNQPHIQYAPWKQGLLCLFEQKYNNIFWWECFCHTAEGWDTHLAWGIFIPASIIATAVPHSAPPSPVHLWEQRTPERWRPLGYPENEKKKENTDYFHAWVSDACITISPASCRLGPCQLDLKWSRSEATARSWGFPLTLMPGVMPREPCNIICFLCHLILLASSFYMPIYTNRFHFSYSCSSRGHYQKCEHF